MNISDLIERVAYNMLADSLDYYCFVDGNLYDPTRFQAERWRRCNSLIHHALHAVIIKI